MGRRLLLAVTAALGLAVGPHVAAAGGQSPSPRASAPGPVVAPAAQAVGAPWCGHLAGGSPLAAGSSYFFTWDLPLQSHPNPQWRRYGTSRLLSTLRRVTAAYHRAHPDRARVGIADLSLPHGGPFGTHYGGLGHASHQNGLDADVLYPRRDGREEAAIVPSQVDRPAAQELVDRFVAAGAQFVFVGQGLGLRGPRSIVQAIPHHLDHLHVRIPPLGPVRAPLHCPFQPD